MSNLVPVAAVEGPTPADVHDPQRALPARHSNCVPRLMPGPWQTLPGDVGKAVADTVLSALSAWVNARDLLVAEEAVTVYVRRLGCMQGARVIEVCQYDNAFDRERSWAFLVDAASELHLITGRSEWIHALNAKLKSSGGPLCLPACDGAEDGAGARGSEDTAAEYLRYFCGAVWGDEGPFRIVEDLGDSALGWAHAAGHGPREKWHSAVKPIQCAPHPTDEGAYVATAAVVYGGCLFRSTFEIYGSGMVNMVADLPVAGSISPLLDISKSPMRTLALSPGHGRDAP